MLTFGSNPLAKPCCSCKVLFYPVDTGYVVCPPPSINFLRAPPLPSWVKLVTTICERSSGQLSWKQIVFRKFLSKLSPQLVQYTDNPQRCILCTEC